MLLANDDITIFIIQLYCASVILLLDLLLL